MRLIKFKKKGITFTTFLQIGFLLTIIITLSLFGSMYYMYSSEILIEDIQDLLQKVAISAQYIIDGDMHENLTDADSKEYKDMCNILAKYREKVGVYDVYTMIKTDELNPKFVLASYDAKSSFMKSTIYRKEMGEAFNGKVSVTDKPFTDNYGTFYTAYAPIYNSKGEINAIIGVDIQNSRVKLMRREIIKKTILLFFVCILIGNLLVYLVAKLIGNNYKSLVSDLKKIGEGDLTVTNDNKLFVIREMKDLEETINKMAERIRYLIEIITKNSTDLEIKCNEILELISTMDTSSQIIASAVEQMYNIHKNASVSFDTSLNELLLYKEVSKAFTMEYKDVLNSIETTKDSLENILQCLCKFNTIILNSDNKSNNNISMKIIEEFKIYCEKLYQDYDLFTENTNSQLLVLDKISKKRDDLVQLNHKISSDFKDISQGNQGVLDVLERQVDSIQGIVKEVCQLENMAEELNQKLRKVKITKDI
ncbi:methyl-accepting chemotaxis protein [Tepidibacter aestuarii]|uniref:methyl-accepting chemotaxis protein n=1 Tax=Tepidibacter aestuarii TaxID=2925782 RepID=UPI0020BFE96B|nr:methyl-accepting chemotaxis protein [Tepidibacter aestuarii]CAH2212112.1 conserved protein of unknown function [Tepidibacter aestuarii]